MTEIVDYDECPHPKCRQINCNKHTFYIPPLNDDDITMRELSYRLTDDIYLLNLGHDGVVEGKDEDVRRVLSHKGLRIVLYCGYNTRDNVRKVFQEPAFRHINFIEMK